jgi:hypothetical protein
MADPVSLAAGSIAALAFQEFIKSSAGELAKKFTGSAIAKIGELRQKIWDRLQGKHALAQDAFEKAKTGDMKAIETVGTLLGVEMLDPSFAMEIEAIAQEINAGKILDQSTMTTNVYDNAKAWVTKVEGGTAYIGEIHQHNTPNPRQP